MTVGTRRRDVPLFVCPTALRVLRQAWLPYLVRSIEVLKPVQSVFTRWFGQPRPMGYEYRLGLFDLNSLKRVREKDNLV